MCDEPYGETYLEVDHVTPIAWGGSDDPSNLQCLCIGCHKTKTDSERQGREIDK
jgi:5-methylcytosine-specific restriction protein A